MILRISSLAATVGFASGAVFAGISGDLLSAALLIVLALTWLAIAWHQWRQR
jgi:hypothetical protein